MNYDPYGSFEKTVLPNGLTVYCCPQNKPFVCMDFIVHVGSREDKAGQEGAAHFAEHLVSRNIPRYPSYRENKKFFKGKGGTVGFGSTSYFSTRYDFSLPNKTDLLAKALDIFSDMLVRPVFRHELEEQRSVISAEFWHKYKNKQIFDFSQKSIRMLLGDNHRMSNSGGLGTSESIASLSYENMQALCDEYYVPANMSIVCVGGITSPALVSLLQASGFGMTIDGRLNPSLFKRNLPSHTPECRELRTSAKSLGKNSELLEYSKMWAVSATLNRKALQVVRTCLADMLFEEVRENRQLAYSISASVRNVQDFDFLSISANIHPKGLEEIDPCVNSVIGQLCSNGESRLKDQIERSLNVLDLHDPNTEKLCGYVAECIAAQGKFTTVTEDRMKLFALTPQDFEPVFKELLSANSVTSYIVP